MLPSLWEYVDLNNNYHAFRREIIEVFGKDTSQSKLALFAYSESSRGHKNEFRDSGERYFLHVLAVACILLWAMRKGRIKPDAELIAAALLHDLIENKSHRWNYARVERKFGARVARLVWAVTKPKKKRYYGMLEERTRVAYRKLSRYEKAASMLRIADRLHNIRTLWSTPNRNRLKIVETETYVVPLAVKLNFLLEELLAEMNAQRKRADILEWKERVGIIDL